MENCGIKIHSLISISRVFFGKFCQHRLGEKNKVAHTNEMKNKKKLRMWVNNPAFHIPNI